MESLQSIRSRLSAVKNVGKITKAMEVVAATKMRKAQEIALASRPYGLASLTILQNILEQTPFATPLAAIRPVNKTLLVIISSDRGLAGSFNTQVFRAAERFITEHPSLAVLAIGKKAIQFAEKRNLEIAGSFSGYGDAVDFDKTQEISEIIINGFLGYRWDAVITISTHFRTTLKQETLARQLLPTDPQKIRETIDEILPEYGKYSDVETKNNNAKTEYIFEPSPEIVLSSLIPYLVRLEIYHVILEANASEHSSRMVAMKTASDNASELSDSLKLLYNKARQAGITQEMIEIISTQNVL